MLLEVGDEGNVTGGPLGGEANRFRLSSSELTSLFSMLSSFLDSKDGISLQTSKRMKTREIGLDLAILKREREREGLEGF